MGNCLITKLKGTVDADLPMFGKLIYDIPAGGTMDLKGAAIAGKEFSWDGSITVLDESSNPVSSPATPSAQIYSVSGGANGGRLIVTHNYDIQMPSQGLLIYNTKFGMDIKDIMYWWNGTYFALKSFTPTLDNKIYGDVSALHGHISAIATFSTEDERVNLEGNLNVMAEASSMTRLQFKNNNKVTGDIGQMFRGNTSINNITLVNLPNVGGTIEDLVKFQRGHGRTTGTISAIFNGGMTFQGEKYPVVRYDLSWTATTITWAGVTINNSDSEE